MLLGIFWEGRLRKLRIGFWGLWKLITLWAMIKKKKRYKKLDQDPIPKTTSSTMTTCSKPRPSAAATPWVNTSATSKVSSTTTPNQKTSSPSTRKNSRTKTITKMAPSSAQRSKKSIFSRKRSWLWAFISSIWSGLSSMRWLMWTLYRLSRSRRRLWWKVRLWIRRELALWTFWAVKMKKKKTR